jgi:hypothetical protein
MASELVKLGPTEKDVTDEASVRLASQIYVWDGKKGVFMDADQFVTFKKQWDCAQQAVEGVELVAMKDTVKDPDWPEIHKQRMKDSKPLREYYEKVVRFRRTDDGVYKTYLLNYWEKGKFVEALLKEPGKYGNKTIKCFAADLRVSESSAYQYQHCGAKWTRERTLEMAGKEMTWRGATRLFSVKDDVERVKIEDLFLAGKLDSGEVDAAVKKANRATTVKKEAAGEKVDRRGGLQLKSLFDSVTSLSDKFQERLAEFVEGYKVYQKLPPEKTKGTELTKSFKAAAGSMLRLQKRLTKIVGEPENKPVAEAKSAETK